MAAVQDFETEVMEWTKWYLEHENNGGDIFMRYRFQNVAIKGLLRIFHALLPELRQAQGRNSETLWLPASFEAKGDMRRFG
jgi:hypothetical protein